MIQINRQVLSLVSVSFLLGSVSFSQSFEITLLLISVPTLNLLEPVSAQTIQSKPSPTIKLEQIVGEYEVVLDAKVLADALKEGIRSVTGKWIIKSNGTFEAYLKAVSTKDEIQEIRTFGKISIKDGKVISQVETVDGKKPDKVPPPLSYTLSSDGKELQSDGQPVKLVKHSSFGSSKAEATQARKAEADRLLEKGHQLAYVSKYREAIQSWEQALTIYREIKDRKGEAFSLNNLGNAYNNLREYQKAIDFYQQSLAIDKQTIQSKLSLTIKLEQIVGEYEVVFDPKVLADAVKEGVRSVTGKWIIKSNGTFESYLKAVSTKDEIQEIRTFGKISIRMAR